MTQRTWLALFALALGAGATWWILGSSGAGASTSSARTELVLAPGESSPSGAATSEESGAQRMAGESSPVLPLRRYERVRLEVLVQPPEGRELPAGVEVAVEPSFDDGGEKPARLTAQAQPRKQPPLGAVASFEELVPASYRIFASAPGLDSVLTIAELDPRAPVQRISLVLAPLGSLEGVVHSGEETRAIAAFAMVALQRVEVDLSGQRPRRETRADGNGRYRFEDVPPGTYDLSVGPLGRPLRTPVRVELENAPARQDLGGLPPVGEVAFQLFDEIGTPLQGVSVDLVPPDPEARGGARGATAADGTLRLGGLPAGEYLIHAQRDGYHPLQSRLDLRELSVPLIQPLVLRAL
ncbi:MAG: carboxypeptidase regulatory-like domain-containing protein [Planctomycetes bacterium]|nr:carboxypeptidase regulatory-like domain-containing protein [Planctomycetota bacterium]